MNSLLSATTHVLYTYLLKPIFFLFDPESVHNQNVLAGKTLGKIPFAKKCIDWMWAYHNPKLTKTLDGITFPNPVGLSAGFDYNGDLSDILPSVGFGFHTIGTITLQSYAGNHPPRLGRFPRSRALLVNKGLKNAGAVAIIKKLKKCRFEIPTGISIASTNQHFASEKKQIEDIFECFYLFETSHLRHAYYELNISCPNLIGNVEFYSPSHLNQLLQFLSKITLSRPVFIKMPISKTNEEIDSMMNVIIQYPFIKAVIIGNLWQNRNNQSLYPDEVSKFKSGNFSGIPCQKRSDELIRLVYKKYGSMIKIIGCGGIFSAIDAYRKIKLGASLTQLMTGLIFEGPQLVYEINKNLVRLLRADGYDSISNAIGIDA